MPRRPALVALILGATGVAHAQVAPASPPVAAIDPTAIGAGLLRNGEQSQQAGGERAAPGPPEVSTPLVAQGRGEAVFTLKQVRFGASRFISSAELDRIASPLIGRPVSFADLQALVEAVNAALARRSAVTARAFLTPQKIIGGVVQIDIVEGRLGKLSIDAKGYTSPRYVRGFVPSRPDAVVDLGALRQSILRFNRTNDPQLKAQLQPGERTGQTDITLSVLEPAQTSIQLFTDSYGYEAVGHYEGGALLRRASTLLPGDRSTLYISGSEGGITGSASYNIATDHGGGRLGFSYGRSNTQIQQGAASEIDILSTSNTASINYARPWVLRDGFSVVPSAVVSWTSSAYDVAAQPVGDSDVYKVSLGANVSGNLQRFGRYNLNGSLSYAYVDDRGLRRHDHAWQINLDGQYLTPAFHHAYIRVSGAAQYFDTRVVPGSQVFQIGGVNSVRGYEAGAASGFAGAYGSLEAHYDLSFLTTRNFDVFAFYDVGYVANGSDRDATLQGVGLGVTVAVWRRINLELSYGHGLAAAPNGGRADRLEGRLVATY